MDQVRQFIQDMTIWNWMAVIAFIVLPISALNAFLGLRNRWKDWRATRNKQKLKVRIIELRNLFAKSKQFEEMPSRMFAGMFADLLLAANILIIVIWINLFLHGVTSWEPLRMVGELLFALPLLMFFIMHTMWFEHLYYHREPDQLRKRIEQILRKASEHRILAATQDDALDYIVGNTDRYPFVSTAVDN